MAEITVEVKVRPHRLKLAWLIGCWLEDRIGNSHPRLARKISKWTLRLVGLDLHVSGQSTGWERVL